MPRPHPMPTSPADSRRSPGGTPAPRSVPDTSWSPSARPGPPRSVPRAREPLCLLLWGSPPLSPAAGNSCPTTCRFQIRYRFLSRSCSNSSIDCVVDTRRALVGLDPLKCFPDHPLGDLKRLLLLLRSAHPTPPGHPVDRRTNPGNPAPSLHPHYRASSLLRDGPPPCPASVLCPSQFPLLGVLPLADPLQHATGAHGATAFPRSMPTPDPSSRHLYAGHHLASQTGTRQAHPGATTGPRFLMSSLRFRHFISGSLTFAFLAPHLTHLVRLFRHAHHHGS